MKIRPLTAFAGVTVMAAVAFAPAVTSTTVLGDGKAQAIAAGDLDVDALTAEGLRAGDITKAGVPFGQTVPCVGVDGVIGFAGPFPCQSVDLASFIPLSELGGGAGSDSWGWNDDMGTPEDETDDRQIALYGTTLGLTYIDITDPNFPQVLGRSTIGASPGDELWRDVKVHADHAFFVTEHGGFGMNVIDLTQLRPFYGDTTASWMNEIAVTTNVEVAEGGNSHNIWINEDTARAYVLGTGSVGNQDTGGAGQQIFDISDPANPVEIGRIDFFGYSHDMECVVYTGPDNDYNGVNDPATEDDDTAPSEICVGANEDWMRIVDVTDAAEPKLVATIAYEGAAYGHQSVLTDDMEWLLWNDEIDETTLLGLVGVPGTNTRTYWANVSDLDNPVWQDEELDDDETEGVCSFSHELVTIDHNMYITGDILWQANYNGGLQVFRISDEGLANCEMDRIGFFDIDPGLDVSAYGGAWNVYPFFGQDQIIVSSLDEGLYVLQTDFEVGES